MTDPVPVPEPEKPNAIVGKDPISTWIGFGLMCAIEVCIAFDALGPRWHAAALAAGVIGRVANAVGLWKRLGLAAVLVLAFGSARADGELPPLASMFPAFTICNSSNTLCGAPAASVIPYTFDTTNGNILGSMVFAGGWGLTFTKGGIGYGADALFGTSANGGWNLSFQGKVGKAGQPSFRVGPILQHGGAVPGNRILVGAGVGL